MTRVIKKKVHIIITAVLTLMIMLTALPFQNAGQFRVEAANFTVNNKHVYLDIYNFNNKDTWHSNGVYIQIDGYNLNKMTRINNSDIYYIDYSSWSNFEDKSFTFICGNSWDTVNSKHYYRTGVSSDDAGVRFSAVASHGKYCYWNGQYVSIDGKSVYKLGISDSAVDHLSAVTAGTNSKRIYFDASFSKLSYSNDNYNSQGAPNSQHYVLNNATTSNIPYSGDKVYYYITNADKSQKWSGAMTKEANSDLWYIDIDPALHKKIRFTSKAYPSDEHTAVSGESTAVMDIPTGSSDTFFADTGDTVVYNGNGGNRGGYWGVHTDVRDAEAGKGGDVVPVPESSFTEQENVLYLNSTFYDYYSDYELNGKNRIEYPLSVVEGSSEAEKFASHRNWVPFRQLSQAMSSYYATNKVLADNTIYTGHYQPNVTNWGYPFSDIGDTLGLRGWETEDNKKNFLVNNNSVKSRGSSDTDFYRYATQGILDNNLYSGNPVMNETTTILPHFNEEFLAGENSKNAKLGEVYENVAFPFTKVDRDGNGIYYWSFDSAATTLRLNSNTNTDTNTRYPYYLKTESMATIIDAQQNRTEASRAGANTNGDRIVTQDERGTNWSKNLISAGTTANDTEKDYPSNNYGFFPLNDLNANKDKDNSGAAKYNYGFGTKIEFDFTLSNNGNITISKNNTPITAATTFNFSGDDDVWVFIDGKLVLDIGGDHGRASGCINFSRSNSYDYSYSYKLDKSNDIQPVTDKVDAASVFVSEVKKSTYHENAYSNIKDSNVTQDSLWKKLGINSEDERDNFYKSSHTLTFFYMERGMWESNMRLQFNFPDNDVLEIGKTIDTDDVRDDLKHFFDDVSVNFVVTNLVTHYGAKSETAASGYNISQKDIADYGSAANTILVPVNGAKYTKNNNASTEYTVGSMGIVSLKDGESAVFTNQFRRGSYIGVDEQLIPAESALYTTTWKMTENGSDITSYGQSTKVTGNMPKSPLSGTGTGADDNRVELTDGFSGGNYNAYETAAKPVGRAIVFRSYSKPDDSVNINLKAAFTNKVNVGKLAVKKAKADNSGSLSGGSYTFTITLSNIGGIGLEYNGQRTVEYTFDGGVGAEQEYTGIPVGTEYTIVETVNDTSVLAEVTGADSEKNVNLTTRTVTGVISYDSTSATKGETDTIVFKNSKTELIDIDVIKTWDRLLGENVPSKAYLCLQATTTPDAENSWTAVDGYSKLELTSSTQGVTLTDETVNNATKILLNKQSWKYTISGLLKTDDNGNIISYRLREYDSTGTKLLAPLGKYNDYFTVTYSNPVAANAQNKELTATNTYTYINMPETGVSPTVNFAVIGVSAVVLAVIALLIYKRRLQNAAVYTDEKRRH